MPYLFYLAYVQKRKVFHLPGHPSPVCFQLALVKLFGDLVQDLMCRFYQDFCQQITPYILMYLVLTSTCYYTNYVDHICPFIIFAYHFLG